MTSFVYDKAREKFLNGGINWTTDTIKAVLVTAAYSQDAATHEFLSSITSGNRLSVSAELTSKTSTAGVADAADAVFAAVSGSQGVAVVLYKDTGTDTTSPLIAYIDQATAGLPVTPNGGDINCVWDNGANKIFKL
ncbi:hypothetical protein [Mycobacterium sp. SMC-11]|uniref:hypothetical protein n=1 Tax=Mycobacterium sp. SMC-11 TaxID=3385969 RepID=UPI00390C9B97